MGAGASAEQSTEDKLLEQKALLKFQHGTCGDFQATFDRIDTDGNGELDRDEFAVAANAIGMSINDEDIANLFETFDTNKNGKISSAEFSDFCVAEAKKKGVLVEVPLDTSEIVSFLGPKEAGNGFMNALLALDANPDAALVPMPDSDWLPIHCILMMGNIAATSESGFAKKAADKALMDTATPLLKKIIALKPECAAKRVMPGVRYPNGQLPLFLALLRGWSFDVVKLLIDAYPEGNTTLDPISETKKGKMPGINKCRFARKIAEEAGASQQILDILAIPKKKKKEINWTIPSEAAAAAENGGGAEKKEKKKGKKK